MSNLISGRAAAKILGVVPQTISNWVRDGKLKPVEIIGDNDMFLFDRATIEQLAADRRQPQPAQAAA